MAVQIGTGSIAADTKLSKEVKFIARFYVTIRVDGEEQIIYSDESTAFSALNLYDATAAAFEAKGKEAPPWFALGRSKTASLGTD